MRPVFSNVMRNVFRGVISPGFSPNDLFATGGDGAWFDPSDLSTLFQLSTTTQAITSVGQSIAFALDKSKPLTLGSELVTNGGFDVSTGWTLSSGASISAGKLVFSGVAAFAGAIQTLSLNSTKLYECRISVESLTNPIRFRFSTGVAIAAPDITTPGNYTFLLSPNSTGSVTLQILTASAVSTNAVIDSVSVRELSGNHAIQTTVANRPVYASGKSIQDVSSDSLNWSAPAGTYTLAYRANTGTVILTGQSLSGSTNMLVATKVYSYVAINRELSSPERRSLTEYLDNIST